MVIVYKVHLKTWYCMVLKITRGCTAARLCTSPDNVKHVLCFFIK